MWLQNLLILGTVVCSLSAPTDSPVTWASRHIDAINEALSLLNHSEDSAAVMNETVQVVSEIFNSQKPTSPADPPEAVSKQGLRGSLSRLEGPPDMIADYYAQLCPPHPGECETSCANQTVTFIHFKDDLGSFLRDTPR
ncbi:granulocyte-macrophage colony-stimulating factor [Choloepus didactylus]|uniref:granulocyte-macrophage colony-stimulating factor n=1 Tax=Choloepus didactylus TaxID=27675 RepID=UPI0018A0FC78|nr:granulocyte-macrophage colony-stimulating factor [Choloepus didactylus]